MGLVFDEASMLDNNVFKYEKRLSSATRFLSSAAAVLTTYYNIADDKSTVDRGTKDVDQIFGKKSPLRFNKIRNFPLYEFGQANPNNTDEQQLEDITVEGECIIQPITIIPHQYDMFVLNHIGMTSIFQITDVQYDSMKQNGLYKVKYRLLSTSQETLNQIELQVVEKFDIDLSSMGTGINPIIKHDDYLHIKQVKLMVSKMIESYKSLFYNNRHNCFMFYDTTRGRYLFDMCGNEFMAKHSIMNDPNSNKVIMLHKKINEPQLPVLYNNSVYNWIELDAPLNLLQHFNYILASAVDYSTSSFGRWNEIDIDVMWPVALNQAKCNFNDHRVFDDDLLTCFRENKMPVDPYSKLIFKFINKPHDLSIRDISLDIGNGLFISNRNIDVYLYTPMIIYIIRKILRMG